MELIDAHLHVIDPRFPLVANQGFVPAPFTLDDYLAQARPLGVRGGALVAGSFQAFDQGWLLDALARAGRWFCGVAQLPPSVTDAEVRALDRAGVRAIRFNLRRGGPQDPGALDALARRVHALCGWHAELYADAAELGPHEELLARLPAAAIDHLGLSRAGLPLLCRLAARGVKVKATGFGRLDFPARDGLRAIHAANPAALLFGTDLPSTRAPRPFAPADVALLTEALGEAGARAALYDNARAFYRLPRAEPAP